ncbi:MAG: serine hydroxymethyltransferase [Pseudomonadota bacterium]
MARARLQREIYFEFHPVGRYVRVAAICSLTGVEAVISGSSETSQKDLERIAYRALERKLATSEQALAKPKRSGLYA